MSVASISRKKYGVHRKIVYVYAATLEEAEYKLKLSSKTSNTSYQHCRKFSIHGTGQGSGNSPMIWCFISSILFDCHNQKAHGITSATPNGDVVVSFSIIGFVDDSTCVTRGKRNETIDQLLERVKYDAKLWHDLPWASGGKLELQKCGVHLIFYNFDQHGVHLMKKISDLVITLENEKGEDIEIRTKKIDEARKASKENRISITTKDYCKMWIQQKYGTCYKRRSVGTRRDRFSQYNWSETSSTFYQELEDIMGRHW